jgi:hypothetical protein
VGAHSRAEFRDKQLYRIKDFPNPLSKLSRCFGRGRMDNRCMKWAFAGDIFHYDFQDTIYRLTLGPDASQWLNAAAFQV